MKQFKVLATALAAALLVACGGGGDGDQAPRIRYSSVVNFGDSLSDAGTYKKNVMANVSAGAPAGVFTVNGIAGAVGADPVPTYTWAQLIGAAAVGTPTCAARSGGFGTLGVAVAGCTNYAQGGSRVADPKGVGNSVGVNNAAGPLTEPVVTQVANYLLDANNAGLFKGTELITVLAGANDIFGQTDILLAAATAAGGQALVTSLVSQLVAGAPTAQQGAAQAAIYTATLKAATTAGATPTGIITAAVTAAAVHAGSNGYTNTAAANPVKVGETAGAAALAAGNTYAATTGAQNAVAGMAAAATTLAGYVKDMVNKGARYVVVVNLPDVSQTPMAALPENAANKPLILAMTTAFNNTLQSALAGTSGVLLVDAFSENQKQIASPALYGITNVTDVACNLTSPANVVATSGKADGSSLVCNTNNLIAGNTSRYLFADNVHPTPYGHKLLSQLVTKELTKAGWL